MDRKNFEKVAGPILAEAMEHAKKISVEYYSNRPLPVRPLSRDEVEEYKSEARSHIKLLNAFKGEVHPREAGLLVMDMPSPFQGSNDEREVFRMIDEAKNDLILSLCGAYGIAPPDLLPAYLGQQGLKDLIVHLASDCLNTPLRTRPKGRAPKPEQKKKYDLDRDALLAETITRIKTGLKPNPSDVYVVEEIIRNAKRASAFETNCLYYRNFYIRVRSENFEMNSILNRISKARSRETRHK